MHYSRKFGQYQVEVRGDKISIGGDYGSNFGHYYGHNIKRFKAHPQGEENDWNRPQIIGMDWDYGMTGSVKAWLYGLAIKGKIKSI